MLERRVAQKLHGPVRWVTGIANCFDCAVAHIRACDTAYKINPIDLGGSQAESHGTVCGHADSKIGYENCAPTRRSNKNRN